MKRRVALLFGLFVVELVVGAAALTKVCESVTTADIIFLFDGSGSIKEKDFKEGLAFIHNITMAFDIGHDKVQVGLVQFTDKVFPEFSLKEHRDKASLLAALKEVSHQKGKTKTGNAISFVQNQYFKEDAGSRASQRVPQIMVLITDGKSEDNVISAAEDLRQKDILVFGIAVGKIELDQLNSVVTPPTNSYLFSVNNYQSLEKLTEDLLHTLCTKIQAKGTDLKKRFSDFFFLVDSHMSLGDCARTKKKLTELVTDKDFGPSSHRIGLAKYSKQTKVEFFLDTHKTKEDIKKAVKGFQCRTQPRQQRNLDKIFDEALSNFFTSKAGGRAEQVNQQVLVIIVDKVSDENVDKAHRKSKEMGIFVHVMNAGASFKRMGVMASEDAHILDRISMNTVEDIFMKLEVHFLVEDCKGANVADIVFIVDESGSAGDGDFHRLRSFLHSAVSDLDIRPSGVRVGIVTYGDKTTAHVYLDTLIHKTDLKKFIRILPLGQDGTHTGAALKFTRETMFTKEKGSREGAMKVVVVITDGESQDDVSEEAAALHRDGVIVYAVGVGAGSQSVLEKMASYPTSKYIFSTDTFTSLKPLRWTLQKTLCNDVIQQQISMPRRKGVIKEACMRKDEADIFFLMDDSRSISDQDFKDMNKFIVEFFRSFRIGPQHVRMGLVRFSDSPSLEFDLTTHSSASMMEKHVEGMRHEKGRTYTGKALHSMGAHFERAVATRGHRVPQYLVVITHGESADAVKAPAEELRGQGVIIYAFGVAGSKMSELEEIAGDVTRTSHVQKFDRLIALNDDVIADICAPDACKDLPVDLLFLVDSSGSLYPEEYEKIKDFLKSVIGKSNVGEDDVHVGVVQFSTVPQLEFPLNYSYTKDNLLAAIDNMQQIDESVYMGRAIAESSLYFDAANGGRPGVSQKLVMITAGVAQDEVQGPAAALRDKGVKIYTIGMLDANITELLVISDSFDNVYIEKNADSLKDLESKLSLDICDTDRECKKTEMADIIFLVDGSSSILPDQFKSMQTFMESVVNQTTVGQDLTHFGVLLYATSAECRFTLNKYFSKQELLKAIQGLTAPTGDTYTAEALKYSLQFFEAMHGGRAALRVPQILMVITDGDATDHHNLKAQSDVLRERGITVFSIGVKDASRSQLEVMAGDDASKVFYVDTFKELETLHKNISTSLCGSTKPACKKEKADLVFLLDNSGNVTAEDHILLKNFTAELVSSLDVREEFVHVGVAQFSDCPRGEFYLDTFHSKDDIIAHISNMTYRGGKAYIGKALDHIKDYFTTSHGSRRSAKVSRNLVLISVGNSEDDVYKASERLRDFGVEVFAVRIGDVRNLQLLQITGAPENLFLVRNFHNLPSIKQKVVDRFCESQTVSPKEKPDCSINIAIGFDVSQRTGGVLVGGHGELQTFLPQILRDISSVHDLHCLGDTPTRIAFQVVDQSGQLLYDTNFEGYSEDVVKKVMDLRMSEPTYFNTSLLHSFREKFSRESGVGVKVLVIFSDGLDEDVRKLERESELLQQSGVSALVTVALRGAPDRAQLQRVEFGRGFYPRTPLNISMPNVGSAILREIDAVSDRECCHVSCKCSGHEGIPGSWGPTGPKGQVGAKGHSGLPGEQGVSDEQGPPGPRGLQGFQGCPGARGQKGHRGVSGKRGDRGEDGLDGVDGEQGAVGADGAQGARGHPGDPGIAGTRGEAGLKGQRGLRGDPGEPGGDSAVPGPKGDAGNPGLPGPTGEDGQVGEDGATGNPGPDGRRGPFGEKGSPGQLGPRGLPGSPGPLGPEGRRGGDGQQGPKGTSGFPGRQGETGPAGSPGLPGRRGANGQKGQPGNPGAKGPPGPAGPRGQPGQDGNISSGPPGPKGAKGHTGFTGYPGLPGQPGEQGTNGYPGPTGPRGQAGNSGQMGEPGATGDPGHPGHRGATGHPGRRRMTECELVTIVRDNCACSPGPPGCPSYPTELVFGLDMSQDVTQEAFERQLSALLSLLDHITISESNCPTGARVAVVAYSAYTRYLVRFQEYRRKSQLIESVKNIALERTSNRRQLGAAMRFVGQNVFKRVRAGTMVRKVAVFFSGGQPRDISDIVTAVMEYRALDIVPAVISLRNAPAVRQALEVDETGASIFTMLPESRAAAADLSRVKNCAICHDPCSRSEECAFIQDAAKPQEAEVDLVMVVDGSREMRADEYAGVQELLGSVVEQLAVSSQPSQADKQARVAVVQQSGRQDTKVEFGLESYQNQDAMRRHLVQNMQQQGSSSALGQTLEFGLKEVLLKASEPRRKKAMLTVVGTQTAHEDQAKLHYISQKAKCEGVALFVVTVGDRYNRTQVEQLASLPTQQHLIHVGRLKADEQGYARRFFRVFLSALNKGINAYPPAALKKTCKRLKEQDGGRRFIGRQQMAAAAAVVEFADKREKFQEQTGGRTREKVHDPACLLKPDAGGCRNFATAWFFDTGRRRCAVFLYGGCGGNGNRFAAHGDCERRCPSAR